MKSDCPLCQTPSETFFLDNKHHFFLCPNCEGIFRDTKQLLSISEEKKRYLNHISNIDDKGYYKFVSPIINAVKQFALKDSYGLDFGCGHTPVLSEHLKNEGYQMSVYDAIFYREKAVLEKQYDFIVCCEVMEHFFSPLSEFLKLQHLLLPDGKLICKTDLFDKTSNFKDWYYKNDPSHVFIYQTKTIEIIKEMCQFEDVKIKDRLITFSK